MNSIVFREMTEEDIKPSIKLWKEEEFIGVSNSDTEERLGTYIQHNEHCSFVALKDGVVIGTILGGDDYRKFFINHLCVVPKYRHLGIATELIRLSEEGAKKRQPLRSYVIVYKKNLKGLKFWEEQGYIPADYVLIMEKELYGEDKCDEV